MAEMEDALRSCMEQLLIAREEGEQIIVEAAREISSQQKKVRDLQNSLEVANKKAATLATENNSLCKAIDTKDKLARELREYNAVSDEQLAGATAKLEAARKQSASLQYEARMLQKELEVRSQEREYDLKSVDAARAQHAESLKKIALLEAECQRLRAMVRKRLPGPAALAKMRDEVEPQQTPRAGASPRRQRSATPPMSPRSVTPMSARSATPRRAPDLPDQSHAVRLRAIEDENNALKRVLATRDTELQFARMKYADEACKLSALQGHLKELTEESKRLSDANAKAESWAAALVSELEHFRAVKQGQGASSVMVSDMSLLDDFAEIERLEMASSGEHQTSGQINADSGSVVSEKNDKFPDQDVSVSNGHPDWVQGVWNLITRKQEASGDSIDSILEEIRRALDQSHAKGDASDALYDRTRVEKMVSNLAEKITGVIRVSAEDNAARSDSVLHDKPEFCAKLEYLVHVCHDVLHEEAEVEIFIDEVCLVLEYIVSQYFSNQVRPDTVDDNKKDIDGDESLSTVITEHAEHDMQSAKSTPALDIQTEAHKEPILSADQLPDEIQVRQIIVVLHRDDDMETGRKSPYYDIQSPTDNGTEDLAQEGKQLATNSEISAAADKLAECQETITNLSKQLQALQTVPNSGILDYKPQSLGSILADESTSTSHGPSSPTPKQVHTKKEHGEPDAAARKSVAQEQTPDAADEASAQTNVQPVSLETPADPSKKKRSPSLLGRMMFRKRVEGSSA